MEVKREIHVNGYEIGPDTEAALLSLGFFSDPFLQTGTRHTPPHHFTFETYHSTAERDYVWAQALEIVQMDNEFTGYIESETVPAQYRTVFNNPLLLPLPTFPMPRCETIELPVGKHKASDIHVKRAGHPVPDELENAFLAHNFYKVCTPRNTIYTFQTESFDDAKEAYRRLVEFFRKPADFPVAQVVPRGYLT